MFRCQADGSAPDCRGSDITSQRSLNVPLQNTACPVKNGNIVAIRNLKLGLIQDHLNSFWRHFVEEHPGFFVT